MKNFFMPTVGKAGIFLLIIILTVFIPHTDKICSMTPASIVSCSTTSVVGIGYPAFYGQHFGGDSSFLSLSLVNLIINIVVFHMLSSLVVFLFNVTRDKFKRTSHY